MHFTHNHLKMLLSWYEDARIFQHSLENDILAGLIENEINNTRDEPK